MKARLSVTQKMTFAAMLLVLGVFSTMVFKMISVPGLAFVRISLTPAIIIYASLSLGPLYGAVVGICSDLIPALIEPFSSGSFGAAINPLVTVVYGLLGVLPWALALLTKKHRNAFRKPWFVYAVLALTYAGLAGIFYGSDLLDAGLGDNPILVKSILMGVFLVLDAGLIVGLHFTDRYFQKRILDLTDIPSPNEIAFIATVCEILLMVILKSLAFYVYYMWISASGYAPLYTYLFASLLLISSLNIFINTFAVSWMLVFTRKFIHNYGYPAIKEEGGLGAPSEGHPSKDIPVLDDEDPVEKAEQKRAKIGWIVFFGVVIVLMVVCIIVISLIGR